MIQPPPIWMKPPPQPALLPGEIHIWRAALDAPAHLAMCLAVLSSGEVVRAERFAFDADRNAYIIAHGALRRVLARYLCCDPRAVEYSLGENGKPRLVQRFTDIRFNLSHSGGLALIALARGRDVGVDLERVNSQIEFEQIAEHYFDPRETWEIRTTPPPERTTRFFDVWTRKEAALKACGAGFTGDARDAARFASRNFAPADGYAGAVACEGDDWRLACWEWTA